MVELLEEHLALHHSQYFAAVENNEVDPRKVQLEDFHAPYDMAQIQEIEKRLTTIRGSADRLDAFHRFSLVERELEPVEDFVNSLAAEVDLMIQAEIDHRRGK